MKLSRLICAAALLLASTLPATAQTVSSSDPVLSGTTVYSSAVTSGFVARAAPARLYDWQVTTGASGGYVLILDAGAVPANGAAVTPRQCVTVAANSTVGGSTHTTPEYYGAVTILFSTTGCFTYTASATAHIRVRIQ